MQLSSYSYFFSEDFIFGYFCRSSLITPMRSLTVLVAISALPPWTEGTKSSNHLHCTRREGSMDHLGRSSVHILLLPLRKGRWCVFHWRCGLYLDAIGVHMQHWLGERKPAGKSILTKYFFKVTASLKEIQKELSLHIDLLIVNHPLFVI